MEQETALKLLESLELLNNNMRNLAYLAGMFLASVVAIGAICIWADLKNKQQQDNTDTTGSARSGEPEPSDELEHSPEFDTARAENLYARGQTDELITYCEAFQHEFPNEVHIYWYLGLAHFNRDQMTRAKLNFEQVVKLNPNWKDIVSGYLDEIERVDSGYVPHSLSLQ